MHCTLDQLVADSGRAALLKIQMIFQDPMASLNPRMRVADIVGEAPVVHGIVAKTEIDRHIDAQLARVGLDPGYKSRYPHQFSGGQRASIGIARALAVEPDFLVCDKSVAALDVSIKAQVLNLFMQLRDGLGLTYLFISQDLGVVEHISDRTVIMYLGRIVEIAPTAALFRAPTRPVSHNCAGLERNSNLAAHSWRRSTIIIMRLRVIIVTRESDLTRRTFEGTRA